MSETEHKLYFTDIPTKTVTLANEKTTMNLLGRLALTLSLADSSGSIHARPIDCYILKGIETTQIILSWPNLVTHYVDLFIDLIMSANKHIDAINMISLSNNNKINNPNNTNSRALVSTNNIIPPNGNKDIVVNQDILQDALPYTIILDHPVLPVPLSASPNNVPYYSSDTLWDSKHIYDVPIMEFLEDPLYDIFGPVYIPCPIQSCQ